MDVSPFQGHLQAPACLFPNTSVKRTARAALLWLCTFVRCSSRGSVVRWASRNPPMAGRS